MSLQACVPSVGQLRLANTYCTLLIDIQSNVIIKVNKFLWNYLCCTKCRTAVYRREEKESEIQVHIIWLVLNDPALSFKIDKLLFYNIWCDNININYVRLSQLYLCECKRYNRTHSVSCWMTLHQTRSKSCGRRPAVLSIIFPEPLQ